MKLLDYGFMVSASGDEENLTHLSNGIPEPATFPVKLAFYYNGDVFATALENSDSLLVRGFYFGLGAPFFISKNKIYKEQGRNKYILSSMLLRMNDTKFLERKIDQKSKEKLREVFEKFVNQYFEMVLDKKRDEEEAC